MHPNKHCHVMLSHAKLLQSHPTLCGPMDCSLPDSARDSPGKNTGGGCHALLQGIFSTRDRTWSHVPCTGRGFFITSSTWEAPNIHSVQFSHSVVSDSLRSHESQHARPPCPSPSPGVHSNSHPSNWWCHPAISSSVVPFSSCPQSLPASVFSNESTLRMRWPKYWSFSFSIIPSKEIPGLISFRMDWLDLLVVQGTLKSLLQHHGSQTHQFFGAQLSSQSKFHIHTWPQEKP